MNADAAEKAEDVRRWDASLADGEKRVVADQMLAAALALAARSWPVFPLRGKVPAVAGGRGFRDATTDPVEIRALWARFPGSNVGVATGARSGLAVLDVDVKHGVDGAATLREIVARLGIDWTPTLCARTASGGWHYYFAWQDGLAIGANTFGPGLDLRAEGGYVVAPPSEGYSWTNDLDIAPWPTDLLRPVIPERPRRPAAAEVATEPATPTAAHDRIAAFRVKRELARLAEMVKKGWEVPWNTTAASVAWNLARIELADWNTYASAADDLLEHCPTDGGFQGATLDRMISSALNGAEPAELGELTPSADDLLGAAPPLGEPAPRGAVVEPDDDDGERPGKEPAAEALVRLAHANFRLGITETGDAYAVPLEGPRVVRPLRGPQSLGRALGVLFRAESGKVAAHAAKAAALDLIEGLCEEAEPEALHLRVAQVADVHYLDIGDTSGRVVRIDATGWQVEEAAPMLFRRTAPTGPLPTPERGGSLDPLWVAVNATPADRPLILAWIVAALFPSIPHPILAFRGEQGSGKSTANRRCASVVDPSPAQTRKAPRDVEAWVTAAAGSWTVSLDNLSSVSEWLSDALCRAVTGEGDVHRLLFTNRELVVFAFRRVVSVNGIDFGGIRDDLADRLLTVDLDRINEDTRRSESDCDRDWDAARGQVLGAVLDLTVEALRVLPDVHLAKLPRMADFARILAAVDAVRGTDGLARYLGQAEELAADAFEADPVLAAIMERIHAPWVGTSAELLDRIAGEPMTGWRPPKGWPGSARDLTSVLRRRAPSLRKLGWTVEDLGRFGKANAVQFRLAPPTESGDAEAATGRRQGGDSPPGDVAASVAAPSAPLLTCADADKASEASEASDEYASSLLTAKEKMEEGRGEGTEQRRPVSVARVAASPPGPPGLPGPATDGAPAPLATDAHAGPCTRCGERFAGRYGHAGTRRCPPCRAAHEVSS